MIVHGPEAWVSRASFRVAMVAAALLAGLYVVHVVTSVRQTAEANGRMIGTMGAKAQTTQGIAQDLDATTTAGTAIEQAVYHSADESRRNTETVRHEKPSIDRLLAQPVPLELRNIARARRIARDRLGAAADRRAPADASESTAGR